MSVDHPNLRHARQLSSQASREAEPLVIIVDDDAAVREALSELIGYLDGPEQRKVQAGLRQIIREAREPAPA